MFLSARRRPTKGRFPGRLVIPRLFRQSITCTLGVWLIGLGAGAGEPLDKQAGSQPSPGGPARETPTALAPASGLPLPRFQDTKALPGLKVAGPGIFELGQVRMDKAQRMVSFPAVLNQADGTMEYLLVTTSGKTHESILRTEVPPLHVHVAMLLLAAKGAGTNALTSPPPQYGGTPGLAILGDPITIEVRWQEKNQEIRRQAEELVVHQAAKAEGKKPAWVYNGSVVWEGTFLAQQDGSLISLIRDPIALINHAGPQPEGDHVWMANADKLPPAKTPVQVVIKLVSPQAKK